MRAECILALTGVLKFGTIRDEVMDMVTNFLSAALDAIEARPVAFIVFGLVVGVLALAVGVAS